MERIVIIGTTGSGKSWLAERLAARLGLPVLDLDNLRFNAGWQELPNPAFLKRVEQALKTLGPRYILTGNYSVAQPLYWQDLTHVIWLDYPFWLTFGQLLARTVRRVATQEVICNGNTETIAKSFLSRHSILVWFLRTYFAKRRKYRKQMSQDKQRTWVHLQNRQATQAFIKQL